ncbi:MAG: preprotein translocase subunit SecG [Rhodospirillales bacterium]
MAAVLLAVHLLLAIFLIAVVLMQRSEGGALGMGGGGGGGGGLMTSRGAGNLLTRATAIIATLFMLSSLGLAVIGESDRTAGAVQSIPAQTPAVPAEPAKPAAPTND